MMPSANRGAGLNLCAPDVCRTPPPPGVPIPYPNFAPHCLGVPFSPKVNLCMLPALNIATKVPVTFGDDPGVLHPLHKDPGLFPVGAPNIFIDMIPAVHLTLPTTGNAMNAPVGAHIIPNVVNVFFNDAGAAAAVQSGGARAPEEGLSAEAVESLQRRLSEMERPTSRVIGGRLFVRLPFFAAETPTLVYNLFHVAPEQARSGVVLDLRGCPGGELDAATRLAADFLRRGDEVVRVEDEDGDVEVRRAAGDGPFAMPVVLLVNGATASAAEVFAGALRGHGRATLVGSRTLGKASVQSVVGPRGAGGAAARYVTVARCALPGGVGFEGAGLAPDVVTAPDEAEAAALLALGAAVWPG